MEWRAAFAAGRTLSLEQAIDEALDQAVRVSNAAYLPYDMEESSSTNRPLTNEL
jgi:hypothetical protein